MIAQLAGVALENTFKRVVLDPARGLILLMVPARAHERVSVGAGQTIRYLASLLGVPAASLRSTRWRRPSDPPNTGPEADCSFYVGERAKAYLDAEARSEADADQFVLDNPPDIVVEVGVTHVDAYKIGIYQDRGVLEYWQVDRRKGSRAHKARFLALPIQGDPQEIPVSKGLPGVTPELFEEALQAIARQFDDQAAHANVKEILEPHGAIPSAPPSRGI